LFRDKGQTLIIYGQALSEVPSSVTPESDEMVIDEEGNLVSAADAGTELVASGSAVSEYKLTRR
jgi:hypothetical protein